MAPASPYQSLGENEIRILRIHPGADGDRLSASLEHHDLNSTDHLYTIISYAWGPPEDPHFPCDVHGVTFRLRKNATQILKTLRSPDRPVRVWLDRLCINQTDKVEKSAQIRLMYRIYNLAETTVIWLGEADKSTQLVANYARGLDIDSILAEYRASTRFNAGQKKFILDELAGHPDMVAIVNGIATLFEAVWFSRVWIRSEGSVSRHVYALRGAFRFTWDQLTAMAHLYQPRATMNWPEWTTTGFNKIEPTLNTILAINLYRVRELQMRNQEATYTANPLFTHIVQARSSLTEKPHDKVYAMSSMASDVQRHRNEVFLRPNYALSWQEIYINAVIFFFAQHEIAYQVLEQAGVIYQGVNSDLPSWVPDWRYPALTQIPALNEWMAGGDRSKVRTRVSSLNKKERQRLLMYRGPLSIAPLLTPLDRDKKQFAKDRARFEEERSGYDSDKLQAEESKLAIQAKWLSYRESASKAASVLEIMLSMQDRIVYLSPRSTWMDDLSFNDNRDEVRAIDAGNLAYLSSTDKDQYITSESLRQAYNATLIFMQNKDGEGASEDLIASAEEWRSWLQRGDKERTLAGAMYHSCIENAFTFRDYTFAYSEAGYMALVPAISNVDDHIVIIPGYQMPFVLRPVLGEWYQLIGTCYVHGMMRMDAGILIEEFDIRVTDDGRCLIKRPQGDVRANGLKLDAGRYVDILGTLGNRWVKLV
ncbi:hypothetical protein B0A52_06195 [Exophiala mesophila]|uniref:Heterokaryon incompatibility domain-containing protein n=1 Tax=Exophiala mesophila TaxID=212818 RepID=A0A438N3C1_EXOME|nr:hypothetical protein B0A52_06195 [Exophiala mesophila]